MHVRLVHPPWIRGDNSYVAPPLGLLKLAGALEGAGASVGVMDLRLELENGGLSRGPSLYERAAATVLEGLPGTGSPVIGIQCQRATLPSGITLALRIKTAWPETRVLLGGPGVWGAGRCILQRFKAVDATLEGEAEETVAPAVRSLCGGLDPASVPGLGYRSDTGVATNPTASPLSRIDTPRPAYHLAELDRYRGAQSSGLTALVEVGRGCGRHCVLCHQCPFERRRILRRSVQAILSEVDWLKLNVRPDRLVLFNLSLLRRAEIVELSGALGRTGIPWTTQFRVDDLDPELAGVLARGGCSEILLGTRPRRRWSAPDEESVRSKLAALRAAGIPALFYLPVGWPGESRGDIERMIGAGSRASMAGLGIPKVVLRGLYRREHVEGIHRRARINTAVAGASLGSAGLDPDDEALIDGNPDLMYPFYNPDGPGVSARELEIVYELSPVALRCFPATFLALQALDLPGVGLLVRWHSWLAGRGEPPGAPTFEEFVRELADGADGVNGEAWNLVRELVGYEATLDRLGAAEPRQGSPAGRGPRLAPGTALMSFAHDIPAYIAYLSSPAPEDPAERAARRPRPEPVAPCHLLAVAGSGGTRVFRLSDGAASLLRLCDGGSSAEEMAEGAGWSRQAVEEALARFEASGIVLTNGETSLQ